VGDLARPDPPLAPSSANVAEILAEHNRNARRIQVIQARPDLTVTVQERANQKSTHPLNGRLLMEQPRNFKLVLYHTAAGTMGDIGSNDTEYWFWVRDKTQKALYFCNYDEAEANRQAATFQPDWIKEAMGLRVISEAEMAEIGVKPGEQPGTLVLTHRPHKAGGETYTRVTILDKATHQIREHQLRSGDQKTILARAEVPEGFKSYDIASESGSGNVSVSIPTRLKLTWVQEGLELDVTFRNVLINKPITQAQRGLFVEPQLDRTYTRVNLAELSPATATASPTSIRETRPAPPSRVRLREPAPIDGEEAARDERSSPLALNGVEPRSPTLTEEVVGPRFPTPPEPEFLKAESSGWRTSTNPGAVP